MLKLGCTKANLRFYVSTENPVGRGDRLPVQKAASEPTYLRL